MTNALVAEALAYGDMGLALPILAPGGVASALTHWGTADQQATYLKEFAGENVPQACFAIAEPQPLFDPTMLKTTAGAPRAATGSTGSSRWYPRPPMPNCSS